MSKFIYLTVFLCVLSSKSFAEDPVASPATSGDWQIVCTQSAAKEAPADASEAQGCRMAQSLVSASSGEPVSILRVFAGKRPSLLLRTPLNVFLKTGVLLQIDKGKRFAFAFEFCDKSGCYAGVPLSKALLSGFKRGNKARVSLRTTHGKELALTYSLKGFTKIYRLLQAQRADQKN
ncbi:invasion associated locus B family protein [Polycladidibacter hongkongensis]|uniref:invasion associated locus B family protein n=1 Tax=Polycladidibacter hongkongensis TaxID=1647556 RepID=UPI000AF1C2E9|nr:invasion associated locus B family protein [Pseudovibrio hongkongensis]